MNKITIKVFFSTFIVLFLASLIPNIIYYVRNGNFANEYSEDRPYLFMMFISVFFLIMVFNFIMNGIIYKRINKLNYATSEVMKGNYDVQIEENFNDEITEVIRNFNTMTRELKSNEYQNKEFVRNFSHELKTPLAAIKGFSDLLTKEKLSKEEQLEYTSIISKEASRLTDLSKNMLLISLVDSKVILIKNDTFNVAEQIRNTIQLTQLSWEAKHLDFDIVLPDKTITSNKELLYQVWLNLLSNSIKFSPSNSLISINLNIVEDNILFSISNKGNLSEVDLNNLFELFYIADKSREDTSSGVGLALTKKIVNKLNGNITVESKNGEIVVTVELPLES